MTIRIYVDRSAIERNANTGANEPPFVIREKGKPPVRCHSAVLPEGSRLVYSRSGGPGRRVWIDLGYLHPVTETEGLAD